MAVFYPRKHVGCGRGIGSGETAAVRIPKILVLWTTHVHNVGVKDDAVLLEPRHPLCYHRLGLRKFDALQARSDVRVEQKVDAMATVMKDKVGALEAKMKASQVEISEQQMVTERKIDALLALAQ